MLVGELAEKAGWAVVNPEVSLEREITAGCCCDLLSWVIAAGEPGIAWVTVRTHMNVVAVASLREVACIILAGGNTMPGEVLQKASQEGIPVLATRATSYEACRVMALMGI